MHDRVLQLDLSLVGGFAIGLQLLLLVLLVELAKLITILGNFLPHKYWNYRNRAL